MNGKDHDEFRFDDLIMEPEELKAADGKHTAPENADTGLPSGNQTDSADSFDYIVPQVTFKQHAKHRRGVSTHEGKTRSATREEREAAEEGFVFAVPRSTKRRGLFRRRSRRRPLWRRILIGFVSVILGLVIVTGGAFLILNEIGRRNMLHNGELAVETPQEDEAGNEIIRVDKQGRVITYSGVSYQYNENLISLTVIGANAVDESGEALEMADAIYILTADAKTGKVRVLTISRDTMADVDRYSKEGRFIDTKTEQIAFAYAYGNDSVTGGDNTNLSLSRLFYGLPMKNYFAINLDALVQLNDTVGGVTLTSRMTFVSPVDGRTISEGETVTLHGKEAERYVRQRDISQLDSNNDRIARQQDYIRAFAQAIVPAAKEDLSVITRLYAAISSNSATSLDVPEITYIAATALTKLRSASDIEYLSLTGKITEGEFAEMHLTDEDTIRTMLEVFYTPLAQVPGTQ